ncbi:TetR family transcriptional regulator [Streptomyces sp. NPDC004788]
MPYAHWVALRQTARTAHRRAAQPRLILEVAAEAVAEQGTPASLREIARRADIGLGTFYRALPEP